MSSNHTRPDAGGPPIEPDAMAITVKPVYASEHSDPRAWQYVFVYHVTIENVGADAAQLFWRHWLIHDIVAGDHEVEGEGVVGESPVLGPGDSHRYHSFCVLRGPTGHMEGFYHFRRRDGSEFRAPIPRFHFHAPPEAVGTLFS
ncbi:Co2+/Mg2+ efflux protein ApaG [Candidatus Palauibacter sp.]|uniref:Co2+/Mg2+ efflux protein ApaG n=1 Tax=Candidatus Palauibacter sp. TaxID=3101350 RepID=UPI003B51F4A2